MIRPQVVHQKMNHTKRDIGTTITIVVTEVAAVIEVQVTKSDTECVCLIIYSFIFLKTVISIPVDFFFVLHYITREK